MTILALVLAVVSLWGIATLRQQARETAERIAKETVLALLAEKGELEAKLMERVERKVALEADQLYADISMSTAFPDTGEADGPIADEYPKDDVDR